MDDHLKELMGVLGTAINESLSDSERIAEAIGEIKRSGYDVFLVLEATVGFNRRQGIQKPSKSDTSIRSADGRPELNLTAQDQAFIKALKITMEE